MKIKKSKEGSMNIAFLLITAVTFPIFLILIADISSFWFSHLKVEQATERAAIAAAWQINQDNLKEAELVIEVKNAEEIAKKLLIENLKKYDSFAEEDIKLKITVSNGDAILVSQEGNEYKSDSSFVLIESSAIGNGVIIKDFQFKNEAAYKIDFINGKPEFKYVQKKTKKTNNVEKDKEKTSVERKSQNDDLAIVIEEQIDKEVDTKKNKQTTDIEGKNDKLPKNEDTVEEYENIRVYEDYNKELKVERVLIYTN